MRCKVTDSYETRKREVIRKDYSGEAHDFLAQAELFLQRGNLFRCRDFARFAAVRALKAVFVHHDIHPPREMDLMVLMEKAELLEPDLAEFALFLQELNGYFPAASDTQKTLKLQRMVEGLAVFVKKITERFLEFHSWTTDSGY
jgi:HEPN domain-containing protein